MNLLDMVFTVMFLVPWNALVFWRGNHENLRDKFFWVLGGVADFMLGLGFAAGNKQYSPEWIMGFMIALLGLYCFTVFMMWTISGRKKREEGRVFRRKI